MLKEICTSWEFLGLNDEMNNLGKTMWTLETKVHTRFHIQQWPSHLVAKLAAKPETATLPWIVPVQTTTDETCASKKSLRSVSASIVHRIHSSWQSFKHSVLCICRIKLSGVQNIMLRFTKCRIFTLASITQRTRPLQVLGRRERR